MNKLILCLAPLLVATTPSWAATFSAGGGAGTSIVDAAGTGDYTSLAAAAADFTSYPGGCTGPWNLLIRSNLTETTTSLFGNNTNGHAVTVRPATGTSVTVSFMISERYINAPGATWDGNIVIGPNKIYGQSESLLDPNSLRYMDTDNFIIDGCNVPGGTERNLTLLTPTTADVGSKIPRHMIRVVADADGAVIRNCSILSLVDGNAPDTYICVLFNSRFVDDGDLYYLPDNGLVQNCYLYAPAGNTGRGVYAMDTGIPGGLPAGTITDSIEGLTVTKNDINVSHRAVQFGSNEGGEISYNKIRIVQATTGQTVTAVVHTGTRGATSPFVTNIIGNHFMEITSPHTGGVNYYIGLGGVLDTNTGVTYNVVNNMIGGLNGTAAIDSSSGVLARGITLEQNSKFVTLNVRHNSISMRDLPNYTGIDNGNRMAALSLLNSNAFAGTINFENNIVSFRQHQSSVISARANATPTQLITGTLNFKNNVYHLGAGTIFAEINNITYNTLTDWQNAGNDVGSVVADPFTQASGGVWKSDSDQHFTADPVAAFKTTSVIAGITTDIDQNPRPTAPVTMGADEYVPPPAGVSSWSLY